MHTYLYNDNNNNNNIVIIIIFTCCMCLGHNGIMRCVHACMHVWTFDYFCGTSFLHSFCIIIDFFF